jgi:hypothetical protein
MNPFFGLDLAISHQQDLLRDANAHRRSPCKKRRLDLRHSKGEPTITAHENDERSPTVDFATT